MVPSPNTDASFFDIVSGVVQGDISTTSIHNLPWLRTTIANR